MAFAFPFFNIERLAMVIPTFWVSSVTLIFLLASITSILIKGPGFANLRLPLGERRPMQEERRAQHRLRQSRGRFPVWDGLFASSRFAGATAQAQIDVRHE